MTITITPWALAAAFAVFWFVVGWAANSFIRALNKATRN